MRPIFLAPPLFLLTACLTEVPDTETDELEVLADPDILVQGAQGVIADGGTDDAATVAAGTMVNRSYTIANFGAAALTMPAVPITIGQTTNATCTVSVQPSPFVQPNGTTLAGVRVIPAGAGAFSCAFEIASNDPDENPYNITIVGLATGASVPDLALAGPGGAIADGGTDSVSGAPAGTATVRTYTVTNAGNGTAAFGTLTIGTQNGASCTVATAPPQQLGAGASATFAISITPSASAWSCTFALSSNDPDESPYDVTISAAAFGAVGLVVRYQMTDIEAGAEAPIGVVTVGTARDVTFSIENLGTAPVAFPELHALTVVDQTGVICTPAQRFQMILGTGDRGAFDVHVESRAAGPFACTVRLTSNDAAHPQYDVTISGEGMLATRPRRGCSAGGGGAWGTALVLVAVLLRRRRAR